MPVHAFWLVHIAKRLRVTARLKLRLSRQDARTCNDITSLVLSVHRNAHGFAEKREGSSRGESRTIGASVRALSLPKVRAQTLSVSSVDQRLRITGRRKERTLDEEKDARAV